jgi:hypothetical protein
MYNNTELCVKTDKDTPVGLTPFRGLGRRVPLFTLNILSWSFPVLLNTTDLVVTGKEII